MSTTQTILETSTAIPAMPADAESILKADQAIQKARANVAQTEAAAIKELAAFGTALANGDESTLKTDIGWKFAEKVEAKILDVKKARIVMKGIHEAFNKAAEKRHSMERREVGDKDGKGIPDALVSHLASFGHPAVVKNWRTLKGFVPEARAGALNAIDAMSDADAAKKAKSKVKSGYMAIQAVLTQVKAAAKANASFVPTLDWTREIILPASATAAPSEKSTAEKAMDDMQTANATADNSLARLVSIAAQIKAMADDKDTFDSKAAIAAHATVAEWIKGHEVRVLKMKSKNADAYAKALKA